jgi:hypothetical protein
MAVRLALFVALLPIAAACGARTQTGGTARSSPMVVTSVKPSEVTTKIVGATPNQREILVDALAGIGETNIDVIEVAPAEKGWATDEPDAIGLGFSTDEGEQDMYSLWQSELIAHVLAVRSSELDLPVVAYAGGLGGGTSAVGKASESKPPAPTDDDLKQMVGKVEKAAQQAGAEVDEVRILEPRGVAIAVTLRVSDPAEFLDRRFPEFLSAFGGPPNGPEGRNQYVKVVDAKRKPIVELAGAQVGDGGTGSGWVRPDLIGCYYPAMSRPTRWEPPPCPAASQ